MNNNIDVSESTLPSYYVGIGASAGGLEAIESLFKVMPQDSGLAFIVIQHLSPDHKSLMPELLSKKTNMPVYRAEDGMAIEPNSIYLIVPRKILRILNGQLILTDMDQANRVYLPIDLFLKSLAEDQGEKAIAIILSGTGSDGTRGCRAIKEYGGMIMSQDEHSAKFDGMPKSLISTGLPDFILPPEEMPKQLNAFIQHPLAVKSVTKEAPAIVEDNEFNHIFALLREKSHIDFTYYKPSTIIRRIERRMSVNQMENLTEYIRYIENHPGEIEILRKELLIGVTNFLRDQEAFALLQNKYIPNLIKNANGKELRVWVAGCSTGEEAYSLAILFREAMEELKNFIDLKIFATDVDTSSIETASTGVYPVGIASDIPPTLLNKYFITKEDSFQIIRSIREMVVFAQHNLVKDPPFTNIDLISCRNLLIYLQPILQRKVFEYFNFSLTPTGILFLGMSETTGEMSDYFEPLDHKYKLYQSRGKRKFTNITLDDKVNYNTIKSRNSEYKFSKVQEDHKILDRFLQTFAQDYILLAMIVNDSRELIYSTGDTATFIQLSPGEMTSDITKLIRKELSIPISTGIQKVLNKNKEMTFTHIRIPRAKDTLVIQLKLKLLPSKKGQEPLIGIFISEMKTQSDIDSQNDQTFDVSKEVEQRISDLEQELQFTRENLQAAVEELETSNEELQSTNEELLSSNEELQSTNEELQSVNEELYTVNSEFQSKITELTEVTNDMDNLLDSTQIASLFLDEDFRIRRYSPKITTLFKIIESDIGRSIFDISHRIKNIQLEELIKTSIEQTKINEVEISVDLSHYLMRIVPYKISSDFFSGVVILFINITQHYKTKISLQQIVKDFKFLVEKTNTGVWEWDILNDKITWSEHVEPMFGLKKGDFKGTYDHFLQYIHPDDVTKVQNAIDLSLKNNTDYMIEHRIIHPDGSVHWVLEVGGVDLSPEGKPIRMLGIVKDVTDSKMRI